MDRVSSGVLAFLLGLAAAVAPGAGPEDGRASLLSNGGFAIDSHGNRWPDDWPRAEGTTWEKEGQVPFLRLQSSKPGQMVLVYRRAYVPAPAPAAMEVRLRVRYTNVKPGEKPWNDARILGHFKIQAGRASSLGGMAAGRAGADPEAQAPLDGLQLPSRLRAKGYLRLELHAHLHWGAYVKEALSGTLKEMR